MSIHDYMKRGKNGNVLMLLDNLPEVGFVDAIKVKNICKARIMSRTEKMGMTPGSPDVVLTSASGEVTNITRRKLSTDYRLSNGNKIRLAFLKENREYIVWSICSENYKVIKLPDNCSGSFNGKKVRPGSYMVCRVVDGTIDFGTAGIVSPRIFRKMFVIPMQPVIKRHAGSGSKRFTLLEDTNKARQNQMRYRVNTSEPLQNNVSKPSTPSIDTSQLGINPSNIKVPTVGETLSSKLNRNRASLVRNSGANQNTDSNSNNETQQKYLYRATHRLVDESKNLRGFNIQNLRTGELKQMTSSDVARLCSQKLVSNIILAKRENGTMYLKGNGVVINNLPEILV